MKNSFVIETKNLTRRFGAFTALSDLNLSLFGDVIIRSEHIDYGWSIRSNLPIKE